MINFVWFLRLLPRLYWISVNEILILYLKLLSVGYALPMWYSRRWSLWIGKKFGLNDSCYYWWRGRSFNFFGMYLLTQNLSLIYWWKCPLVVWLCRNCIGGSNVSTWTLCVYLYISVHKCGILFSILFINTTFFDCMMTWFY